LASKNTNPLASLAWFFFYPLLTDFYIFGQLFSDLASENSDILIRLVNVLKIYPCPCMKVFVSNFTLALPCSGGLPSAWL
jgi:hypothetical protein